MTRRQAELMARALLVVRHELGYFFIPGVITSRLLYLERRVKEMLR